MAGAEATTSHISGREQKPNKEAQIRGSETGRLKSNKIPTFKEKFDDITSELTNLGAAGISPQANNESQLDQNDSSAGKLPIERPEPLKRDGYA